MRTSTAALQSFLLSKVPCFIADLFTFYLANGDTYRWTTGDSPIFSDGLEWEAVGPILTRSAFSVKNTIEVPQMDIALLSNGTDFDGGQNIKYLIQTGLLDGAFIELDRVWMPTYGDTSLGRVLLFGGKSSVVEVGAKGAKITVKGANLNMQQYIPRNVYSTSCIHTLYDTGCGANKATFTGDFPTVGPGNPVAQHWTGPPYFAAFNLGTCLMLDGPAQGQERTIIQASDNLIVFAYPLYNNPVSGNLMRLSFGCDRTMATCGGTFGRLATRRGFDYIPPAETGV